MPRLSIIIPALVIENQLEETLASVLENRPDDSEVIVVHSGPYSDPYDLKEEVRFVEVPDGSSLLEALAAGLQASCSEVVHLLARGSVVNDGWVEPALQRFDDLEVAAVTPIIVDSRRPQRVVAGVRYTRFGRRLECCWRRKSLAKEAASKSSLGPTFSAAFYRRSAVDRVGGFLTEVGNSLADIDLALSLQALGYKTLVEPRSQIDFDHRETSSSGAFRESLGAERLFWRHLPQHRWLLPMMLHPLAIAMEVLGSLPRLSAIGRLLGRLVACKDIRRCRRYYFQLRQVSQQAEKLVEKTADEPFLPKENPNLLRVDAEHQGPLSQRVHSKRVRQRNAI